MKLVKLLEEVGYSKYVDGGKTDGLTSETLESILTRMADDSDLNEESTEDKFGKDDKIVDSVYNYVLKIFPELKDQGDRLKGAIRQGYADSLI